MMMMMVVVVVVVVMAVAVVVSGDDNDGIEFIIIDLGWGGGMDDGCERMLGTTYLL